MAPPSDLAATQMVCTFCGQVAPLPSELLAARGAERDRLHRDALIERARRSSEEAMRSGRSYSTCWTLIALAVSVIGMLLSAWMRHR